jgi:hypothetical protein
MAQRIVIKRMPNSMREKAQKSIAPKATGVKMNRRIRVSLIILSIIDSNSASNGNRQ